jgi:hypothetical protein
MTITDHRHDAVSLWDDVLRAYSAALDEQRAFLLTASADELQAAGVLLPPIFAPPLTMPPMPTEFVAWAQALMLDTQGLTELAADTLGRIPAPAPRRHVPSTGEVTGSATWDRTL